MKIIAVSNDGCIKLSPQDLEELHILPGEEFVITRDNDLIVLTPLPLLPAQNS